MTTPRLRQPLGTRGGGQFAAEPAHPEAEIEFTVDDEVEYLLHDGSWEYPPSYYSSPEVMIRFWEQVPVSDTVLERISLNYTAQQRIWAVSELAAWERTNVRPPDKAGFGAKQSQENVAAWRAARQTEFNRLNGLKAITIPDPYIRVYARIAQMHRNAMYVGDGDAATRKAVCDTSIEFGRNGSGTVESLTNRWLLNKLPGNAFKDPTRHMPDQLDKMVTSLGSLNEGIEKLQEEVYRMSALQNMSPANYAAEAAKHGW